MPLPGNLLVAAAIIVRRLTKGNPDKPALPELA